MKKELTIITGIDNFFGQRENRHKSIDVNKVKTYLSDYFNVKITDFDNILNNNENIENSYILYTSSQEPKYKEMIEDVMFSLKDNNTLLPSFEYLKAHENKGFQEILRKKLGIKKPGAYYFANLNDLDKYEFNFPMVFKLVEGAGSKTVSIVNSKKDIYDLVAKKSKWHWKFTDKKDFSKTQRYKFEYLTERFVLQEFLPGLNHDFKILVFGDKYYAVKRKVRPDDFRASGSGKLEYIDADEPLLNFAEMIFKKLKVPFASLDVCKYNDKYYLTEFQCMHLGPLVLLGSQGYFKNINNSPTFVKEEPNLEKSYADSIIYYLKNNETTG